MGVEKGRLTAFVDHFSERSADRLVAKRLGLVKCALDGDCCGEWEHRENRKYLIDV